MMASHALPAFASDSAWVLKRGSSYWELQGGYGRYTDGDKPSQQVDFTFHGELGVLENTTLILEAPFITRIQERKDAAGATTYVTNNGLTDLYAAGRIRLVEEPFSLVLIPALRAPIGYDPSFLPEIGNHTLDLELALAAGYDFKPIEAYIQGGIGGRYHNNYDKNSALVLQGRTQGQTYTKPTDQIFGFLEVGGWLIPQLFASVGLHGEFALTETNTWPQSKLTVSPLLAWRLTPYADLSLQLDQALWSQNQPFLTQFLLGGHFRFGQPLDRGTGLRGGVIDYAIHDQNLE